MKAPKPHEAEWKRVVGMAALGGVMFRKRVVRGADAGTRYPLVMWDALMPNGSSITGTTKYWIAKQAASMLGAAIDLPDAPKSRTEPAAPGICEEHI